MTRLFLMLVPLVLSGCLLEGAGQVDRNLKPYGAHWIKEGMTTESRRFDYVQCGGGTDLNYGYDRKSEITNKEFFDGLNVHVSQLLSCMKSKDYVYLHQCDAQCLYP